MSNCHTHSTSHEASLSQSENGQSPPIDESDVGESPKPEEAERGSRAPEAKAERGASSRQLQHAEDSAAPQASRASEATVRRKRKLKDRCTKGYVDLLNESILDASSPGIHNETPLPPSQIGASLWTSIEKETLFSRLAVHGPVDLRSLSSAIGSKSEAEVHLYLKLFHTGAAELEATSKARRAFSHRDIPAAYEVSVECEKHLEAAGDCLASCVERQDVERWKEKYGDHWLIDEKLAEELDSQAEQEEGVDADDEDDRAEANSSGHPAAARASNEKSEEAAGLSNVSSARLLRPAALLQLSRTLYMNSPAYGNKTWHDLVPTKDVLDGPAIYHSALEDFYNLVVSFTRRLVQASIFQALSRLRASDAARTNWQPVPCVDRVDVRTAVDIMGLKPDWNDYWARVARRCELDIFSEIKKFKDGRPGTKVGYKISYDEVEAELGIDQLVPNMIEAIIDEDDRDFDSDSDMYTLASLDEDEHSSDKGKMSQTDEDGVDSGTQSKKLSRGLSPQSYERAEDAYLDAIDLQQSAQEERRLCDILELEPSKSLRLSREDRLHREPKRQKIDSANDWRYRVNYEADWEQYGTLPSEAAFRSTEQIFRARKARKEERKLESAASDGRKSLNEIDAREETVGGGDAIESSEDDYSTGQASTDESDIS